MHAHHQYKIGAAYTCYDSLHAPKCVAVKVYMWLHLSIPLSNAMSKYTRSVSMQMFPRLAVLSLQEAGGANIVTHPRQIEGSVRKADDRRKRKREEKADRQKVELSQREQELKRLKNLKKQDIHDRRAIRSASAACTACLVESQALYSDLFSTTV